jgi:DNA polymerase-1
MTYRALVIDGNNFYSIAYWSAIKKNKLDYVPIKFFEKISEAYNSYKGGFTFLFIAWDSLKNNRKIENSDYKANRAPKPDDFYTMMPYILDVLAMREVQQYKIDGFEGDDIIYSVVEMCKEKGYDITVSSADHDMYQLIDTNINIYDPRTRLIVDYNSFINEYKIEPFRWKYVKSMMTDKSDNIPGVKGIGPKGAIDIILKYGDLDTFYSSDMSKVSASIKNKMTIIENDYDAKKSAYDSLKMVEFRKVDLPYPSMAVINPIKVNRSLYVEYEE